jgi:hypothetical protein
MNKRIFRSMYCILLGAILILAACTTPTPQMVEVTRVVPQTVVVTQINQVVITSTPEPVTPTALPPTALPATATVTAESTEVTAVQTPTGLNMWCMPEGFNPAAQQDAPTTKPAAAKTSAIVNGIPEFQVPFSYCTFVYSMDKTLPEGTELQVLDSHKAAWLKANLIPVADQANVYYAVLTHSYIINPPLWRVTYTFVVHTPDGNDLRSDQITFRKWIPKLCWNGGLPNVNTLTCVKQQDIHPWDLGYPDKPSPTPE